MRLSDAIALGRTLLKPTPYMVNDGDGNGCAWGMALASKGFTTWPLAALTGEGWEWDWAGKQVVPVSPCKCKTTNVTVHAIIVHIFNYHVCIDKSWTLDQLIDWVRANEPAEVHAEEKTIAELAPSLVAQG